MDNNRITGIGILLFCAVLWFAILPAQTEGGEDTILPRIGIITMAVPSLVMLACGGSKGRQAFRPEAFAKVTLPLLLLFALCAAAVPCIGFFTCSASFIAAAFLLFGERRPLRIILTPACVLGIVYAVLRLALNFDLPRGLLI